jgi:hypothetical protein
MGQCCLSHGADEREQWVAIGLSTNQELEELWKNKKGSTMDT